ncbi:ABC transporter ATP-binding protein [bacterium]|nr:ABC transporter ATP-binding protein [bacterium]
MKFKDMIRFFKKYFKGEKRLFIKSFFLLLATALVGTLYGYLIGLAIDKASNSSFAIAIAILFLIFVINLIDNLIFDRYGKIYMEKCANNMMEKIGLAVYEKVGMLPARAFEEKSSGEFINRITSDASTISDSFRQVLRIAISLFTSLIVFIYICFNSIIVAFEVIIYLVLFYLLSNKYLPSIKEDQKEINKQKDEAVANVSENIRGIREIRALGIRKSMNNNFKNLVRNTYFKINKQMITEKNYNAWVYNLNTILEFVIFATCILLIINGTGTFAFFMAMTYYVYRFMNTIELMTNLSSSYQKMKVSMERINEILDNKLYKDETFGTVTKTDIEGNIEFKNVTFKYPNEEKEIFKEFNIKIPTGKKIAIVGKSGQGKTSIFNLLLRYFDVDSGVILIDDLPIEDFTEDALRQNIAIIRQEPFIFNKTILENLKIIDPYMSLKKIRNACKLAEIDDYIMSLTKKYDTMIGEGGINLSGGQKQRLAIARALLKDSKIILFDEATSALDNENQAKIKKAIDNLVKDHTIIIVAHRLSTIIDADIIYLIDDGQVVDEGTHKSLLRKNEIYKTLYENEE